MVRGPLTRKDYVQLLQVINNTKRSGVVVLKVGRLTRTIHFIAGVPVAFESNLPEESLDNLVKSKKLMPEKTLTWLMQHLGEGEDLDDALRKSGAIEDETIDELTKEKMSLGIGNALKWKTGQWTFEPNDSLRSSHIDGSILPSANTMDMLWSGLKNNISRNEIFTAVNTLPRDHLKATQDISDAFDDFSPANVLQIVNETLLEGSSLDDIATKVTADDPDFFNSGDLFKLIWLLHVSGQLSSSEDMKDLTEKVIKRKEIPATTEEKSGAQEGREENREERRKRRRTWRKEGKEAKEAKDEIDPNARISEHHKSRMGKDFYAFLKLDQNAPYKVIDKKCKLLMRQWKGLGSKETTTDETSKKIQELIRSIRIVHKTLTNPDSRAEYDNRMKQGRAPIAEVIQSGSTEKLIEKSKSKQTKESKTQEAEDPVLTMVKNGKHKEALPLLEAKRADDPSNSDVLAALGWARWNVYRNRKNAEEYLQLALTWNSRHLESITYLAKIALASKDHPKARKLLKAVVSIEPQAAWAKKAIANLPEAGDDEDKSKNKRWFR